jgi:hypothetical protein
MDSDTARLIRRAGRAVYGERWQSALAGALGVNIRTVRRWAAGQQEAPAAIIVRLRELVRARIEELRNLLERKLAK